MEFEGQYLTYSEYRELGGTLDQTPFNLLEFECRREIDEKTSNRLKDLEQNEIPFEVKICEFKLIDSIVSKYDETITSSNNNVESENIDGYSVKYISPTQIKEIISSKNAEVEDTIETELFGVIVNNEHILYVGVK